MSMADLAELISEEMSERGWSRDSLAIRMSDWPVCRLTLDMILDLKSQPGMKLGDKTAKALALAFGLPDHNFLLRIAGELPAQFPEPKECTSAVDRSGA
jgi:hypothetical protein